MKTAVVKVTYTSTGAGIIRIPPRILAQVESKPVAAKIALKDGKILIKLVY